jgi:hypothetical protein
MLEHVPRWLGHALRNVRAGADRLCIVQPELGAVFGSLDLSSPAFADGARLPPRFTADGEGVSPPLLWGPLPQGTTALALIVEDPDAPAPQPLVHALIWGIPTQESWLPEGAIRPDGDGDPDGRDVGRNSYLMEGWLPPDPPPGHGEHRYAFQLFALGDAHDPGDTPGRAALVKSMAGKVLAAGLLTGTYSREEAEGLSAGALSEMTAF